MTSIWNIVGDWGLNVHNPQAARQACLPGQIDMAPYANLMQSRMNNSEAFYSDVHYFTKAFKSAVGVTPGQFRLEER